jgi:hypothetical protein
MGPLFGLTVAWFARFFNRPHPGDRGGQPRFSYWRVLMGRPAWRDTIPKVAWKDLPVPLHPGAILAYRELGFMR